MYLRRLSLTNFRAYERLQLELQTGLTVFLGPNAAGKTSLLEAIHLLATTKSPRTNIDCELVRWETQVARVEGLFVSRDRRETRLAVGLEGNCARGTSGKRLEVEGEVVSSARELIGRASVVMFAPDDLAIIKGGPSLRRRFLNTAIAQLRPTYLDDLARYRRALAQRNELLKSLSHGRRGFGDLDPWTGQLVQAGVGVALERQRFVADLDRHAAEVHRLIGGQEVLSLKYQGELAGMAQEEAEAHFRKRLEDLTEAELRRGSTLAGPHRDDVEVQVNGVSARQYGSQGQQRTAALSLKLGQARVSQEWIEEPPLLLLDDCLSELDPDRAGAVLDLAGELDGLIVTSAKLDPALQDRPEAQFFQVAAGTVQRQ
ncbi:MAG: DNA replication/repair protein RecF [Armatimonadota bacterium]